MDSAADYEARLAAAREHSGTSRRGAKSAVAAMDAELDREARGQPAPSQAQLSRLSRKRAVNRARNKAARAARKKARARR